MAPSLVPPFPDPTYPDPTENWPPFIRGTLHNTENLLLRLNGWVILGYLALMLLMDVARVLADEFSAADNNRRRSRGSFLKGGLFRMVVIYGSVLLVAKFAMKHIDETNWAKAIKSGKAYRFPVYDTEDPDSRSPSTLPHKTDILINKEYSSEYYGSYTRVMEYAHPGNVVWRRLKETHGEGYSSLPNNELRNDFCRTLIDEIHTERRFLKPDLERHWTRVTDPTELGQFCRRELTMASSRLKDALLRQIDSLMTETRFGRFYWRAIQEVHMPSLLRDWDERIASAGVANPAPANLPHHRKMEAVKGWTPFFRGVPARTKRSISAYHRRYTLPPKQVPKEPFEGAWWQEGDVVEVMYKCKTNSKCTFRGSVQRDSKSLQ
jgi:hypothetical protein